MPLGVEPIQVVLVVAIAVAVGYVWYLDGRGRWRSVLTDRFVYGVPWGTLVTVAGVVAFYLFAQSGLDHWSNPVTVAFRNWSYAYPLGLFTSGFAHASPGHLIGNLVGTVVLAPIAEFAWGHYPPGARSTDSDSPEADYEYPPPSKLSGSERSPDGPAASGLLARPWVRAVLVFPAAVFVLSIVTSVLALGWSLGFSGTVFVFGGFAVVVLPLTTIVAMLGITAVGVGYRALTEPVLRVTADPGSPGPPSWAGVNVQAHMLGFLLGVVLGLALLRYRERRPDPGRVFLAVLLFAIARQLWLLPWSEDDVFVQYRGVGLVFVLVLTVLITAAAAADDELLAGRVAKRTALLAGLLLVVGALAVPSAVGNFPGMDDDPVPGEGVEVADYHVTYAEDAAHGRIDTTDSGVIVVSERRDVWISGVSKRSLAHDGSATIPVGGVGWRTPVEAERAGWEVTGNDSVYVVDIEAGGETTRSFESPASKARPRIANHTVSLLVADGEFRVAVAHNRTHIGTVSIPGPNETATVGPLQFRTEPDGSDLALLATHDGTRVEVARRTG
jgi:membrane associated rhomboid family serine protease